VGLYFNIYKGVWSLNSPRLKVEHEAAIKSLRPGFDPRSNLQEQQDFEASLNECLNVWSKLDNKNIVQLLGISMGFGKFPALITTWMTNGLLTEYLSKHKNCNKMKLIIDVGRGVAYLHSKNIVHSDLRAVSVLVDGRHNARLADPGLLPVLEKSPLIVNGEMSSTYRWMAPELLDNAPPPTSSATDVYAFTMTSLEIFTGSEPFAGVRTALVPGQILQNHRPGRPDGVRDALWALWNEGWNQDPAKRPDMQSYLRRLEEMA